MILKATQFVILSIAVQDKEGNAASVDGVPKWTVSDPAVGVLEVAEDGMSAKLIAGTPTTGSVTVEADADLGEGVVQLIGALDVQVVSGDAAVVTITPGTPAEQ